VAPRHSFFLNQLEKEVPPDQEMYLMMDNYSTHKSAAVQRWLKPKKRRRFQFFISRQPAVRGLVKSSGYSG
jgi:hypothetical protein